MNRFCLIFNDRITESIKNEGHGKTHDREFFRDIQL